MARHLTRIGLVGLGFTILGPAFAAESPVLPAPGHLAHTAVSDDAPRDLALAAACLERGEETAAVAHLNKYVNAHPNQPLVRAYLADLLWKRNRLPEARTHYERFLTDAQLAAVDAGRQVHAHTRLTAIARRTSDVYAEHLHRGIGLYLIALQSAAEDGAAAEGLLCKAAGELTLAQRERAEEARPSWYLHLVWARLGQSQPAERSLRRAAGAASHADLTPAEQRDLAVATVGVRRQK